MSNLISASSGRSIAPRDSAMIYAILATGTAAAMTVDPMFWLATPLLGIVTLLASKRAVPRVEPSDLETSQLPLRVELEPAAMNSVIGPG